MANGQVASVEGTITLPDGRTVQFLLGLDSNSRWGADTDACAEAVDACDAMIEALSEQGLLA